MLDLGIVTVWSVTGLTDGGMRSGFWERRGTVGFVKGGILRESSSAKRVYETKE